MLMLYSLFIIFIDLLLNNEKLDIKYACILRILLVYCNIAIAITENIATIIPKGMYFDESCS